MTMLYSFHENLEVNDSETQFDMFPSPEQGLARKGEVHIFAEKLRVPKFEEQILRPRLNQMLANSSRQFGATLILGRAGTGKTALAADFARQYKKVAWYSIESADSNWAVFSKYFTASFNEPHLMRESFSEEDLPNDTSPAEISYFIESLFARLSVIDSEEPRLIVIDNAHYVFDAEWFTDFFQTLISALSPNMHFLILSRCKPALPLWRLRSKQALGVVDEKLLSFNFEETQDLFRRYTISPNGVKLAYRKSFGRISKLKEIVESL